MAQIAAAEGHCNMAHAIQDMPADRSHDQEAAGVLAAGTDRGVVHRMEAVVVARDRMGGMAVSMQVLAPVENIQALSPPQVERHREPEHAAVVMGCSDQVVQKHSSAKRSGWRTRS